MNLEDKEYNLEEMTIEDITDLGAQLNAKKKKCDTLLEDIKSVVKARFLDKEISATVAGKIGDLKIQEADDFHPIDPKAAFDAMVQAGFEKDFPSICTINLKDSGKTAKVKTIGILRYLSAAAVEKIRIKKRAKALTVYLSMKKD